MNNARKRMTRKIFNYSVRAGDRCTKRAICTTVQYRSTKYMRASNIEFLRRNFAEILVIAEDEFAFFTHPVQGPS